MELASLVDNGVGAYHHEGDNIASPNLSVQLELRLSTKLETGKDIEARSFGHANEPKKEKRLSSPSSRGMEQERAWWRCSAEEERKDGIKRKKMRLSKEQSCYLEESFRKHTSLTPKQKLAIAKQLDLRPRQVEVWFQNRRARTKLKQMEMDREYLKQCYEYLAEENRRLQKEIQEHKAPNPHHHMHAQAATVAICQSCGQAMTTEEMKSFNFVP